MTSTFLVTPLLSRNSTLTEPFPFNMPYSLSCICHQLVSSFGVKNSGNFLRKAGPSLMCSILCMLGHERGGRGSESKERIGEVWKV